MTKRSVIHEKLLAEEKYTVLKTMSFLTEENMFSTVTSSKKFSIQNVREVIANLLENFGDAGSQDYGMFRIRGNKLSITPGAINAFYGTTSLENFQGESNFDKIAYTFTRNSRSC